MGELKLSSAQSSNMTDSVANVTVDSKEMDSPQDQDETEWTNTRWTQYWGYFTSIPDLKSALIMKSVWTVGKGWTADTETSVILDHISGWGKDSWDDVILNLDVMRRVGGDSYAEIIKDDSGLLLNLKPLNPGSMKHVVDRKGMIKRFEQTTSQKGNAVKKWKPEEIFYLANNRFGDSIHGISDIEALESTILADNESSVDMRKLMHRQARPMIMFKLGTDDPAKINAFADKMDKAVNKGENMYIPNDKDAVDFEIVQAPVQASLFSWRDDIRNKFYRTVSLPQIVPGAGGQGTESESKVIYLAFEQLVAREQRFLELQIWNQLNLKIKFNSPTSLSADLQRDEEIDNGQQTKFQSGEVQIGAGTYA